MQIQYYGNACFKIYAKPGGRATEDIILFFDPLEKSTGLRSVYGQAHLILSSRTQDIDLTSFKGEPICFHYPGEYSVLGINILAAEYVNEGATLFLVEVEDLKIAFLGQTSADLSEKQRELTEEVDILFLPVGGHDVLEPKKAAEIARNIEPNVIIPMCYAMPNLLLTREPIQRFYEELGMERKEMLQKYVVKSKDIEAKKSEIVELEPQR